MEILSIFLTKSTHFHFAMGFANCILSPRGWILELLKRVNDGCRGADEKEGNLVASLWTVLLVARKNGKLRLWRKDNEHSLIYI